ncbi:MAG: hypothetical protein ABFS46_06990 [Myxococcota bacterium]
MTDRHYSMLFVALSIASALGAAIPAAGQVRVVEPGPDGASGQRIQPYANEWTVTAIDRDGGRTPLGVWKDSVDVFVIDGAEHLRRVQSHLAADGSVKNTQVHVVERATMMPVRSHFTAGARVKHVDIAPGSVSGFLAPGAELAALPVELRDAPPAFDFDIAGLMLVALDLAPGDTVRFPSYALQPAGMGANGLPTALEVAVGPVTVFAEGRESIEAGRLGAVEAVRAVVERGARVMVFWLLDEPPYIVRLEVRTPRDVTAWEMP